MTASYEQDPNFPYQIFAHLFQRLFEIKTSPWQAHLSGTQVRTEYITENVFKITPTNALELCWEAQNQIAEILESVDGIALIEAEDRELKRVIFQSPDEANAGNYWASTIWSGMLLELDGYKQYLTILENDLEDIKTTKTSSFKLTWNKPAILLIDLLLLLRSQGTLVEAVPGDMVKFIKNNIVMKNPLKEDSGYLGNLKKDTKLNNVASLEKFLKTLQAHLSKMTD